MRVNMVLHHEEEEYMVDLGSNPIVLLMMVNYGLCDQDDNLQMLFVAGRPISAWLAPLGEPGHVREKVVWNLLHLCLSIYKLYGLYLRPKTFQTLLSLIDHIHTAIGQVVGVEFVTYLYHFVVGQDGHLPPEKTYSRETTEFLAQLRSGRQFVLSYEPDQNHMDIPFTFSFRPV
ncbi:hypothetical protein BWQ96_04618 [Gracilariopsis chorda]|uniref:Uncharacterized protein n=1 Tax=Gracilariopsis chorda TaxID=448386 RepID=A0A2V3IU29_9FLOR|nr:hypothetical protein BWQ96_04618 [Gracilariopsis chorda]|eukprot:PXF45613.1 hypothetical protein BWQ96_04618 [Gracilariopsis chorda]